MTKKQNMIPLKDLNLTNRFRFIIWRIRHQKEWRRQIVNVSSEFMTVFVR